MSFSNFFKSLVPNFEKTRVLEEFELAKKCLIEETLPPFKQIVETKTFLGSSPFKSPEIKRMNALYQRESGQRQNIIVSLTMIYSSLSENMNELEKYIDNSFKTNNVVKIGLTYNKIALLRVISLINFFTLYGRQFMLYTYGKEIPQWLKEHSAGPSPLTKGEVKWLEDHLVNFARCAKIFSQPMRQILNTLESVPDLVYDPNTESDVESQIGRNKVDPLRLGFVPIVSDIIWFFGSAYVEYQAKRYQQAKEMRRTLEMRLLQLKDAQQGKADAAQDKVIQVNEERLRDLNYSITKMERDFGV